MPDDSTLFERLLLRFDVLGSTVLDRELWKLDRSGLGWGVLRLCSDIVGLLTDLDVTILGRSAALD